MQRVLQSLAIGCTLALVACSETAPPTSPVEPAFAGSDACRDCHAAQYDAWQNSHHDLAMQVASTATVLGDFSGVTFEYFDTESRFLERDGEFIVRTENASGESEDFRVAYTFGVEPLQQYLVELPGGRLQALPFAWDARTREAGGQRWYHLYPDSVVSPADPLHWTRREQNWNYQCAECHSTNVEVNYDIGRDSFKTTWSEIDVSCEACHGPGTVHAAQAESGDFDGVYGLPVDLDDQGRSVWEMNLDTGVAGRSEPAMRPPQQPESCGRCHARRGLIAASYEYGRPLADTHRIALLDAPLYFADGQIQDEVYVYGSFVQSRMYRAGVTCSDCHDPHSLTLVTGSDPNAACGQCHLPDRFATPEHHRHTTIAPDCVECHMTARVYMGIDARRDHSFRIPRPDLSLATGAPNACTACHDDRDDAWAAARAREWWGDVAARRPHFAIAHHKARTGFANPALLATLGAAEVPGISRATALTMLAGPFGRREAAAIERALGDGDALVRMGALRAARVLQPELQLQLTPALLEDPALSVRIEAASVLAPYKQHLPARSAAAFSRAADEYRAAQRAISSRPEAHTSLGDFEAALGNLEQAVTHYEQSLAMEPDAPPTRANLADTLRRQGDETRAEAVLRDGIKLNAANAALRHALGLLLVRTGRVALGTAELETAAGLDPGNSRYSYVLGIALNSAGETQRAVQVLTAAKQAFPGDFDIAWALATILRDQGELTRSREIARQLSLQYPDNGSVAALLESLRGD